MLTIYATAASRSRRVLWTCEEVGAAYEVVELAFPPKVHHPDFLALNPAGTVPTMVDGEVCLTESLAICDYVARRHGSDLVVAPDAPGYSDYLNLLLFGEATLLPPVVWTRRFGRFADEALEEARETFAVRLGVVDRALADGREFLTAGRFTLADISVGFTLGLSRLYGLDRLFPPAVAAYYDRLAARPAHRRVYLELTAEKI
jgi:glutathione S-transferase